MRFIVSASVLLLLLAPHGAMGKQSAASTTKA